MYAVFIYFASELSVFPQYDVSIMLPVINENYRNSYSSLDSILKVSAVVTIDKLKKGEKKIQLKQPDIVSLYVFQPEI